ncbi:uncharacterized protein Bfra_004577 [Botrytis fragariae]|uniref:Uncharacterized protein n=1 Tax=Botrytis fragariae TaxID=1964551 RepID=A0A8H6AVW5_9HELO|nr:uncharacterized protein Bfra_004577 [Botrytis fragariae]KAF5874566.1 hypothetical protein Bfra_004577 [Botrytis fragariae]
MQQSPKPPDNSLHNQNRTLSFHSLLNLASLSPLRNFLARAPISSNSSSTSSISTPAPCIPQIHPGEYETYKSVNKLLSTFNSRSIAKARRANAKSKAQLLHNEEEDTYRSIHCGDQNCCFSSPYSVYRTRSSLSSSITRSKNIRSQSRSRSVSNPNLRLASLKGDEKSLAPSVSSLSLHPFRRSLTITGSSKRSTSLFSGSPPPSGESLRPLYKYPEPVGPRSSSWLNGQLGMGVERSKSVSWTLDMPVNRRRRDSQHYRPSSLSRFSWTAEDIELGLMKENITVKEKGEREIAYEWDGAFGWTQACKECGRERCVKCSGIVFEQIVEEGETVTGEEGIFNICTPCVHGFCPGTKMWLRIKCRTCGEVGCLRCSKIYVMES